ncbi:MAG: triose-phosphate isomerase family protein [Patescibacteria group bacterium]|nr:triose-phosphate isomerase [Patescibacteria group bacterium]
MQKLVVANWKSNKSVAESLIWCERLMANCPKIHPRIKVVVAPAFPSLASVADFFTHHPNLSLVLGIQDISPLAAGSYTGAVSGQNLRGLGVKYALVGHIERRRYFGETNQDIAKKVEMAVDAGLIPIVCVEKENARAQATAIRPDLRAQCIVSYDPSSAISTHAGGTRKPVGEVSEVIRMIKSEFGCDQVIYGGSVTEENVAEYMLIADGVLVCGASLDPVQFARVVDKAWVETAN